jgi:hypothetical protein
MGSFATELFREVRPGFFRVLAGRNAATYADALDALEIESAQRHEGMSREEALGIVEEVLARHPDSSLDLAEAGDLGDFEQESLGIPTQRKWPFYVSWRAEVL